MLNEQGVSEKLSTRLGIPLPDSRPLLDDWRAMAARVDNLDKNLRIAMVGKYTGLSDSYLSVIKALQHAAFNAGAKMNIDWVEAEYLEPEQANENPDKHEKFWQMIIDADCVLVAGGVGNRGVEG